MQTFDIYGHIQNDEDRRAAEVIDLTYGDIYGDTKSITDGQ